MYSSRIGRFVKSGERFNCEIINTIAVVLKELAAHDPQTDATVRESLKGYRGDLCTVNIAGQDVFQGLEP